jgi:hypothetical protein
VVHREDLRDAARQQLGQVTGHGARYRSDQEVLPDKQMTRWPVAG